LSENYSRWLSTSDLDNLLKYIIAEAEHGKVTFIRLTHKPEEKELRDLLALYPFIINDKIKLYCAPPENPMSCYMATDIENFICQTVTQTRISCYSSITGHIYNPTTSKKIMEALKLAYALCVNRLRKTISGEDKFDILIQKIKQTTGIPTNQGIMEAPKTEIPLKEDIPKLAPCYEIAKLANIPGFIEALNQHNFEKARSFIPQAIAELATKNVLRDVLETARECGKILSGKK